MTPDPMKLTPLRAIRQKCLDCSNDNPREVTNCWGEYSCPLYPYRFGTNPARKGIGNPTGNPLNFQKIRTQVRNSKKTKARQGVDKGSGQKTSKKGIFVKKEVI